MKTILKYIAYLLAISLGFALLYIKGFSESFLYITAAIILIIAIAEMALKYGFNSALPKQSPSTILIRLLRYGIGAYLFLTAQKILDREIFEVLLSSKKIIVPLWAWIVIELIMEFIKEFKEKSFQPADSDGPEERAAD